MQFQITFSLRFSHILHCLFHIFSCSHVFYSFIPVIFVYFSCLLRSPCLQRCLFLHFFCRPLVQCQRVELPLPRLYWLPNTFVCAISCFYAFLRLPCIPRCLWPLLPLQHARQATPSVPNQYTPCRTTKRIIMFVRRFYVVTGAAWDVGNL